MSEPAIAEGLIVGRLRFGETSCIVTWLARGAGRIKTMAKGALRPASPMARQIDLFYCCEFRYRRSRTGEIHGLSEVRLKHPFLKLRESWLALTTAHYFVELIEAITEPETEIDADYDLLMKALEYLETHEPTLKLIQRFESQLLRQHGLSESSQNSIDEIFALHHFKMPKSRPELMRRISS